MPAGPDIPRLDELLSALRQEGVPVGPAEAVRIRHAFGAEPRLDRDGLRGFLACLLVKRPDHERIFQQLFDAWCPDLPADALARGGPRPRPLPPAAGTPPTTSAGEPPAARERRPPRVHWGWYLAGAALAAALVLIAVGTTPQPPSVQPAETQETAAVPPDLPEQKAAAEPAEQIRFWQARVDPASISIPRRLGPAGLAGLGTLFALGASFLAYRHRKRTRLDVSRLARAQGGPGWLPLPAIAGSDVALTGSRERRAMSWNVARFTAEDPTRRIDEPATANATARAAGLPEICYARAKYPREVWLWRDTHCELPELAQLLEEIRWSLMRGGLSVRIGGFPGVPTRVWWRAGDFVTPSTEDGHRDHVMVALLTDGADMLRALRAPGRRGALAFQLRNLQHWPHLAVVDFSHGAALARALAPFHLKLIRPADLPAWIGGAEPEPGIAPPAPTALQGDTLAWAAVCALAEDGVDEATAQRLRQTLELPPAAWQIRALRQHAGGSLLAWAPEERRMLVNWLLGTGFDEGSGVLHRESLARRAIDGWLARYEKAQAQRAVQSNRLLPWQDTEAERRWALDAALLCLYLDPEKAVQRLSGLAAAGFEREIRRRLAALRTWDMPREPAAEGSQAGETAADWRRQAIYLPWRWGDYQARPELLAALQRLGLGGQALQTQVTGFRPPMRFALAVGALAGLALAAFAAAAVKYFNSPAFRIRSLEAMLDEPALAGQTLRIIDERAGEALIGDAKQFQVVTGVPPGAEIPVAWAWAPEGDVRPNNPVVPYAGSKGLLLLGGTLAEPVRPCVPDWPPRSLAVVQAEPRQADARQLAIQLLDRGSADLVLIAGDWQADLARLPQRHRLLDLDTQLLVFLPPGSEAPSAVAWPGPWVVLSADYGRAAEALDFAGVEPVQAVPGQRRLAGAGVTRLHGGPTKLEDLDTGITWVRLCPGTFTMGTAGADPKEAVDMAHSNERPAHRVSLSAFEMSETEITNAQYRRVNPGHDAKAADDLPAVNVDWKQARDFCRTVGGDLPTEAQWEYAARAGSRAPWSFGSDAGRLGRYAWYNENSGNNPHPVKQKEPNPFGLYDMHGNAWEWVMDRYGEYTEVAQLDPSGPNEGSRRVLRGGSFVYSPRSLRSANRGGVLPVFRNWNIGFRCVRVPARQD